MNIVPIDGFDGYFISDEGVVFCNLGKGNRRDIAYCRVPLYSVKPRLTQHGYERVYMRSSITNKRVDKYIHRLVAEHFIENPFGYKYVNHIDANRSNNSVQNLEWCTAKQNTDYTFKLGHMIRNSLGQYEGRFDYGKDIGTA